MADHKVVRVLLIAPTQLRGVVTPEKRRTAAAAAVATEEKTGGGGGHLVVVDRWLRGRLGLLPGRDRPSRLLGRRCLLHVRPPAVDRPVAVPPERRLPNARRQVTASTHDITGLGLSVCVRGGRATGTAADLDARAVGEELARIRLPVWNRTRRAFGQLQNAHGPGWRQRAALGTTVEAVAPPPVGRRTIGSAACSSASGSAAAISSAVWRALGKVPR